MSDKKINLEEIIIEAYGCKDAHDFQQSFDISIQMIKEICIEACRQTLELAAENVSIKYEEIEQGENQYVWLRDYPEVNKKSITDTINQVE